MAYSRYVWLGGRGRGMDVGRRIGCVGVVCDCGVVREGLMCAFLSSYIYMLYTRSAHIFTRTHHTHTSHTHAIHTCHTHTSHVHHTHYTHTSHTPHTHLTHRMTWVLARHSKPLPSLPHPTMNNNNNRATGCCLPSSYVLQHWLHTGSMR